MKHTSPRRFALRFLILASLHFAVVWLVGLYLFSRYGFSHPPVRDLYETMLGAGVICLGLPDTVFGWLSNSALYGVGGAAILHLCRHSTDTEEHDSASIPNDRNA
jgi:hypothetical protein